MFEVYTYAAPTKYVPDWLDNRERWKNGKDFFWVEILPLNDTEIKLLRESRTDASGKTAPLDFEILKTRISSISNLSIRCNDGSVNVPKNGEELLSAIRPRLDEKAFEELKSDLVLATLRHSELSAGELKGSDSSSDSSELVVQMSASGDAGSAAGGVTANAKSS